MSKLYGKGTITEIIKGKKYRLALSGGKHPKKDEYMRHQETFLGTKRQAELRIEQIRSEMSLKRDLLELDIDLGELASYGLTMEILIDRGMSAIQASDELERLKLEESKRVLFGDYLEKYLSMREGLGKYRPATLKLDRSRSKHLLAYLGNVPISEIKPNDINELYIALRQNNIGATTILHCHKLLKRLLGYAYDNDLISKNPADKVETPKVPKPKRTALTAEESRRLSSIAGGEPLTANKVCVYLGLSLGARLGEVLGLTWGHVMLDGERPFAHIVQQHTANNERTALKTDDDSNPIGRVVPLDASTIRVLKAWKAIQVKQLNEIGIEAGNNTPIITSAQGCWLDHAKFEKWWRDFCVANGLGRFITDAGNEVVTLTIGDDASLYPDCVIEWRDSEGWPCDANGKRYSRSYKRPKIKRHYSGLVYHELRHSHFTLRLASGIDIPTAQALGGWRTPAMLVHVYAHETPETVWNAVGFMDKLTENQLA